MPIPVRLPLRIVAPLVTAATYYVAAAVTLALTHGKDGVAAFWPANGILLAALLIAHRRDAWRYGASVTVASFLANFGSGIAPLAAAGYTAANVAEVLLAWRLAFGGGRALPSFVGLRQVARFFIAALVSTAISATLATLFALNDAVATWSSWVTTDLLGLLIVTPAIVTACAFAREQRGRLLEAFGEAAALLAAIAAVATIAFAQTEAPLLFLPVVGLLLATLRLGPFGAAGSVTVIALIGSAFTLTGNGMLSPPGHHIPPSVLLLFVQFYLLVLLGTGLPLAALLAGRDQLVRRLAESNRLLRLAERNAGLGHWWLGIDGESLYCSPEVARIHGFADDDVPTLSHLIARVHADDRERVAAQLHAALRGGTAFDYEARIVTAAGEERRVHSTGDADRAADGTLLGLFGTLQDVTRRSEDQEALEAARLAAEQAARLATAAAETDALTGVANRRKIAALLDAAIAAARDGGHPLSVAMLDLDHFKDINDAFGHLVGDHVLTHVARVAAASLRGADVVGRMGGEEFILLLPTAGTEQAVAIAERVRLAIATTGADGTVPLPPITASLGIATLIAGEDAVGLLHRADCALYDAKRAGRNRLRQAA